MYYVMCNVGFDRGSKQKTLLRSMVTKGVAHYHGDHNVNRKPDTFSAPWSGISDSVYFHSTHVGVVASNTLYLTSLLL